jgi:hypothetical protein
MPLRWPPLGYTVAQGSVVRSIVAFTSWHSLGAKTVTVTTQRANPQRSSGLSQRDCESQMTITICSRQTRIHIVQAKLHARAPSRISRRNCTYVTVCCLCN